MKFTAHDFVYQQCERTRVVNVIARWVLIQCPFHIKSLAQTRAVRALAVVNADCPPLGVAITDY